MLDEQALKQRLQEIVADDYKAPSRPEIYPLVLAMGTYIGSVDPELRDDLIYMTLAIWIERDIFEAQDLNEILKVVLNSQHLFLGLGEQDTDTVFTRTFSMMIVAAILIAHRRRPFLPDSELQVVKSKVLRYLDGEKDLRGYVPVKGWAHAIAHAADTLDELAQCDTFGLEDLLELLEALRKAISCTDSVYICEEDERLVTAVLNGWQREEISEEIILAWLQRFDPAAEAELPMTQSLRRFVNNKNFLRSLYFRTKRMPLSEVMHTAVRHALARYSRFA
jgi:hypothetical protein